MPEYMTNPIERPKNSNPPRSFDFKFARLKQTLSLSQNSFFFFFIRANNEKRKKNRGHARYSHRGARMTKPVYGDLAVA